MKNRCREVKFWVAQDVSSWRALTHKPSFPRNSVTLDESTIHNLHLILNQEIACPFLSMAEMQLLFILMEPVWWYSGSSKKLSNACTVLMDSFVTLIYYFYCCKILFYKPLCSVPSGKPLNYGHNDTQRSWFDASVVNNPNSSGYICFEQTVVQITDKILLLGTEVAFCPLAILVFLYFHENNKEHFGTALYQHWTLSQRLTTGYKTEKHIFHETENINQTE